MCFHVENLFLFYCREDSDVDTADKDGYTPLMVAARAGSTVAFAKLLEKADVGKIDNQLMTVVLAAEEAGHSAILRVSCTYNYGTLNVV